jgi:hypothetical protein
MTSLEMIQSPVLEIPSVYEGIEEFNKSPEEIKDEIIDHCEGHTRFLEGYRAKSIAEGADPFCPELRTALYGIDAMAEMLSLVWETDSNDAEGLWPLYLKYTALMNQIKDLEIELNIPCFGIPGIIESHTVGVAVGRVAAKL